MEPWKSKRSKLFEFFTLLTLIMKDYKPPVNFFPGFYFLSETLQVLVHIPGSIPDEVKVMVINFVHFTNNNVNCTCTFLIDIMQRSTQLCKQYSTYGYSEGLSVSYSWRFLICVKFCAAVSSIKNSSSLLCAIKQAKPVLYNRFLSKSSHAIIKHQPAGLNQF